MKHNQRYYLFSVELKTGTLADEGYYFEILEIIRPRESTHVDGIPSAWDVLLPLEYTMDTTHRRDQRFSVSLERHMITWGKRNCQSSNPTSADAPPTEVPTSPHI